MKRQFITLLALLTLCAIGNAASITLAWDPNPASEQVSQYSLYEEITAGIWQKVQDVTGATSVTLQNVAPGVHTYAVTASNVWGESARSNPVSTPSAASPPGSLILISISIQ